MSKICAFTVYGDAKPQGSTKTITRPVFDKVTKQPRRLPNGELMMRSVITHSNRESLMQWRQDIRNAIQLHAPELRSNLVRGPIAIRIRFAMTKPPSVSKRRLFPVVAPDLDKLLRAVGDALEHTVLYNDSQIVHWECWKVYTDGQAQALIEIWQPDALVPVGNENPFQQMGLF
jgi:Holliday junction resolvase RusA-like endonuclease